MAAKQSFNIEALLECPICLNECDDPRVLPCLHSLCRKCLQEHIKTSAEGSYFKCPSCRHACEVPPGGVTTLPKNFLFNSLKEMLQQQSKHGATTTSPTESSIAKKVVEKQWFFIKKDNAQHTRVTVFCVECAHFFCSNCETYHKLLGATSEHQLRPAAEVDVRDVLAAESTQNAPRCDQHRGQFIEMYCDTCSVPMCMKCCLLSHKQHEYRELDQKAEESREQLVILIIAASNLISSLDTHMQELDVSLRNIEKNGKEACEQVSKTAEELRAIITSREQNLIKKIRDSQKTALTQVRAAYKEAEINKAGVQSLHSYIQTLQVSGKVTDQVVHTPGLQEQLRQQEATPLQSVTWTVDLKRETQNEATLQNMLGAVSAKQAVATSGAIPDDMKVALTSPVLSLNPDVHGRVSGLAVMGDRVCVTGWYHPYLWIHNTETNANKQHTVDGLQAVGMATIHGGVHNNNTLVITDYKKKLHFITISPDNMNIRKHTVKDIPFQPFCVSVDSATGKLIITNYTDKQIVICDNTGNIEKNVTVNTSIGNMWCALATDDGYIVLDGSNRGRVHWVNKEGEVIHTYGQCDGEGLSSPQQMIPDSQRRLVVADYSNHRLHLIDVNRHLSHYLLTENDGINNPYSACFDETTERLFVGHYQHNVPTVSVYKWPFTSTSDTHHHGVKVNLQLNRYM